MHNLPGHMKISNIKYDAPEEVKNTISSLGRTEDIVFSQDGYFAIAQFIENKIILFKYSIKNISDDKIIYIESAIRISSDELSEPHGISFLGEDHLLVANRGGELGLFERPHEISSVVTEVHLNTVCSYAGSRLRPIRAPGSVDCFRISEHRYRVLVCNNYIHTVVSFEIDVSTGFKTKDYSIVCRRLLSIPDGISISPDKKWVAVSSHDTHEILVYKYNREFSSLSNISLINRIKKPAGRLSGTFYPHGLRFSPDGKTLFVADAGMPYIHAYYSEDGNWSDRRWPQSVFRVMDDQTFDVEINNPGEGGIKGLDIFHNGKFLATTTEHQPLKFYEIDY